MTGFQKLKELSGKALPDATIRTGYGKALDDFLQSTLVGGTTVFISLSLVTPRTARQSGKAANFIYTYTLYVRGRTDTTNEEEGYQDLAIPLIVALDGEAYTDTDGERMSITVEECAPIGQQGFDVFALNVRVA